MDAHPFSTVVGSWPLSNTLENMEKVFKDLIQIGVDFPCYPQLISMIDQFLDPLAKNIPSLEIVKNRYYLSNDFKVPKEPVASKPVKTTGAASPQGPSPQVCLPHPVINAI